MSRLHLRELLAAVEDAAPIAAADVVGEQLREAVGAVGVSFLIADFSGRSLIRLSHSEGDEVSEAVPLTGTPHGRALSTQDVVLEPDGDMTLTVAPVTNRGEAIGVLELCLPGPPDEETLTDVALAAHALAYVLVANRRFTDLFEWGKRSVALSLAAEIQHRLLPGSYTCEGGQFTVAAWLEPAGDVGGDTFDFAMDRDTLHLSMTDAMGHAVNAAVLATVLVGALRNARRGGADLARQAQLANAGLRAHAADGGFVTGQVARIDLQTATATIVNAGHPVPLRLRDGRVEPIELLADPPFGTVDDFDYRVQELPLEPGDRIVFLTDGMLERNASDVDIAALLVEGADLHPREAVQHLAQSILEASEGELQDDATAMIVDWRGGASRERNSESGADEG